MSDTKAKLLESIVHAILIAAVAYYVINQFKNSPSPIAPQNIAVGDTLTIVKDNADMDNGVTLLLALSPTCPFCTQSLPFYRELSNMRDSLSSDTGIVAIVDSSDFLNMQQRLLEREGVGVDSILSVRFDVIGIYGVPEVLHLDSSGVVAARWIGVLDQEGESEVFAVVIEKANELTHECESSQYAERVDSNDCDLH